MNRPISLAALTVLEPTPPEMDDEPTAVKRPTAGRKER